MYYSLIIAFVCAHISSNVFIFVLIIFVIARYLPMLVFFSSFCIFFICVRAHVRNLSFLLFTFTNTLPLVFHFN